MQLKNCLIGIPLIAVSVVLLADASAAKSAITWKRLEKGLELARAVAPIRAEVGDSIITILRADLRHFRLRLLSAKILNRERQTAAGWARKYKLLAATNASLYARDLMTSVGLMVDGRLVNNKRVNGMGAILGFNPRSRRIAPLRIVDRRCEGMRRVRRQYRTLIQGPRLWDCRGRNMWKPEKGAWSMAVLATDRRNRVLFLYTRAPYSVHRFANMIRRMPLGIRRAIYLDGGRPSQIYIKAGGTEVEETGSFGSSGGAWLRFSARPIPNVIGIERRK